MYLEHGHALNLAVGDTIKESKVIKDVLDTAFEVTKLVKYSPKTAVQFEKLKNELVPDCPGFRVLCPTRWTVRAASLKSIIDNYSALQELWHVSGGDVADPSVPLTFLLLQHSGVSSYSCQVP